MIKIKGERVLNVKLHMQCLLMFYLSQFLNKTKRIIKKLHVNHILGWKLSLKLVFVYFYIIFYKILQLIANLKIILIRSM